MNKAQSHLGPHEQHLIASVMLAEIAGYEDRPIFEQIDLTTRTRQLFQRAVADSACVDTQIIDREDSIVLLFPGDPRDCLGLATRLALTLASDEGYSNLPLRIGVNLGPIALSHNELSEMQISGAGIDDAERVARAGALREILMSRSFYTVLSRASMDDRLLRHKAFISDERDQSFAVYQLTRPESAAATQETQSDRPSTPLPHAVQRSRARWSAIAAAALIATVGVAIYQAQQVPSNSALVQAPQAAPKPVAAVTAKVIPAAANAAIVVTEPDPTLVVAPESVAVADESIKPSILRQQTPIIVRNVATDAHDTARKAPQARPVTVQLAIKPWGEVFVDGKKVGVTPPLHKIAIPPGKRQIVVRNSDFLPFETTLDIQPESLLQISHRFGK
jgi:hypothetical protein